MILLEVLVFPDCPGRRLLEGLASQMEASFPGAVQVEEVLIDSPEQAERYDFHGSPTLLVDGHDIDETKRGLQPVFGCRMYNGRPAPDLKWILDRLQRELHQL